MISIVLYLFWLVYSLTYCLPWEMVMYGMLENMRILLLGEVFSRYQLGSMVANVVLLHLIIFSLAVLSVNESEYWGL